MPPTEFWPVRAFDEVRTAFLELAFASMMHRP